MSEAKTSSFPFACVVVTAPIGCHQELTYAIPKVFQAGVLPGMRVLVPVGRRKMTGIVTRFSPSHDLAGKNLKYILDVLDETPVFSKEMMELWRWTANYYLASLGDILSTILPSGLRRESKRVVTLVKKSKVKSDGPDVQKGALELTGRERTILDFVVTRKQVTTKSLSQRFPSLPIGRILHSLEAQNLLTVREHIPQTRQPKAHLAPAGTGTSVPPFCLSSEQGAAYAQISAALGSVAFRVFLLHGVTGSGKTEVYVRAAHAALRSGKHVLMLVPEIGLTHQLVERARQRFGSQVAVMHSGLRPSQRWAEWQRIARGEAQVIIGARSAIFAPVSRLGLIVVDEEHDGAYKQEEGVRYNARDLAVVRGRISSCPVVLGSATPSLESYLHSQSKRYTLLSLPQRIASRPLPEVEVVDLRRQGRPQDDPSFQPCSPTRIFSVPLQQALIENHQAGRQSLLFMNRRGYANYLQCRQCGQAVACGQCSVTLTWHRADRALRCHYCGFSKPPPQRCPSCSSALLRDSGVGTQQVEEALTRLIPSARVGRLDRDTARRRGALDRILGTWRAGELDVLVGTQMIAKGHDVPSVTLVGVLLADISLNLPDFRAAERTFQLLAQVAGRAGRGDDPGRVIIQTYSPAHYSIQAALQHDFAGFAKQELGYRKRLDYPPFARAVNIRFESADSETVMAYAERFARRLQALIKEDHGSPAVLGPAPAPIEKIKGRVRWHLLLKGKRPRALHSLVRQVRQELLHDGGPSAARGRPTLRTIVDVDPYSML